MMPGADFAAERSIRTTLDPEITRRQILERAREIERKNEQLQ